MDKLAKVRAEIERRLDALQYQPHKYDIAKELKNLVHFIISLQEEPVSEDLHVASMEWLRPQLENSYAEYGEGKQMELTHFDGYAMLDAIEFGAKWQKAKDQETIELAEDHAMLAGMNKMEEQMTKDAVDGFVIEDIEEGNGDFLLSADYLPASMGLKDQQKVKVIILKD